MEPQALGTFNIDKSRFDTARFERLKDTAPPPDGDDFADMLQSQLDARSTSGVKGVSIDKTGKLYEQCEALETFFLKTVIGGMRKTVEKADFNKTGFAGEMYEDMLWDEYAKDFAKNAGFGFAELAYLELTGQRGKTINRAM